MIRYSCQSLSCRIPFRCCIGSSRNPSRRAWIRVLVVTRAWSPRSFATSMSVATAASSMLVGSHQAWPIGCAASSVSKRRPM